MGDKFNHLDLGEMQYTIQIFTMCDCRMCLKSQDGVCDNSERDTNPSSSNATVVFHQWSISPSDPKATSTWRRCVRCALPCGF